MGWRSLLVVATMSAGCDAYCASVAPADCAQQGGCAPIEARPVVEDTDGSQCVNFAANPTAVGCMAASEGCDDVITWAEAPDGDVYWFSNSCIPDDFVPTDELGADPACGD